MPPLEARVSEGSLIYRGAAFIGLILLWLFVLFMNVVINAGPSATGVRFALTLPLVAIFFSAIPASYTWIRCMLTDSRRTQFISFFHPLYSAPFSVLCTLGLASSVDVDFDHSTQGKVGTFAFAIAIQLFWIWQYHAVLQDSAASNNTLERDARKSNARPSS